MRANKLPRSPETKHTAGSFLLSFLGVIKLFLDTRKSISSKDHNNVVINFSKPDFLLFIKVHCVTGLK